MIETMFEQLTENASLLSRRSRRRSTSPQSRRESSRKREVSPEPEKPRRRNTSSQSRRENSLKREVSHEPENPKDETITLEYSSEEVKEHQAKPTRRNGVSSKPIPLSQESEENVRIHAPSRVRNSGQTGATPVLEPEGDPEDESIVVLSAEPMDFIHMYKLARM